MLWLAGLCHAILATNHFSRLLLLVVVCGFVCAPPTTLISATSVIYLVAILVFKLKGVQAVRRQSSMYNDTTTAMTDAERDLAVAAASQRHPDVEAGKGHGPGGYHGAGAGAGAATPRNDADRRRSLQKAVMRVGEAALQSRRTSGSATSSPTATAPATAAAGGAVPTKDNPMLSKALLD